MDLVRYVSSDTDDDTVVMTASPQQKLMLERIVGALRGVSSIWLLGAMLVVYEIYTAWRSEPYLPRLTETFEHFRGDWLSTDWRSWFLSDLFWRHGSPSLTRFLQGWTMSVVIGVTAGVALGLSKTLAALFNPAIRFSMAIPKTVLLPLALVIFGVRDAMNVFLILIGTVWVILINTMDGVADIDSMWLRSGRSLKLSRWQMLRKVILPAASPQIFAGVRVSLGVGLILMVVSELYATTRGLGYQIALAQKTFEYLDMWSAIMLVAIIGIVMNGLFGMVEARMLRWHRRDAGRATTMGKKRST
jgi:ABC-type nitrate/sulfonate/bicarbonate transport system permease component